MTNKKLLEGVSKLQMGCAKLCKENKGVYDINGEYSLVSPKLFHELEREEGLLMHVKKRLKKENRTWYYSAMTQDGTRIETNETAAL